MLDADGGQQIWTIMHSLVSEPVHDEAPEGRWPRLRNNIITLMSPPSRVESSQRRFFFSLFYVVTHVFTFANTILYWAVLVPTGNGGFAAPTFSRPQEPPQNQTVLAFDPGKCHRDSSPTLPWHCTDSKCRKGAFRRRRNQGFQHHQRLVSHLHHCPG
jgi:hypothetical protein